MWLIKLLFVLNKLYSGQKIFYVKGGTAIFTEDDLNEFQRDLAGFDRTPDKVYATYLCLSFGRKGWVVKVDAGYDLTPILNTKDEFIGWMSVNEILFS